MCSLGLIISLFKVRTTTSILHTYGLLENYRSSQVGGKCYIQTEGSLQSPFLLRPERMVRAWGWLGGIGSLRETARPQARPSTSSEKPYQSLGTRFVLSTYSPHIQASPPITKAFCSELPEGKQAMTDNSRVSLELLSPQIYLLTRNI